MTDPKEDPDSDRSQALRSRVITLCSLVTTNVGIGLGPQGLTLVANILNDIDQVIPLREQKPEKPKPRKTPPKKRAKRKPAKKAKRKKRK